VGAPDFKPGRCARRDLRLTLFLPPQFAPSMLQAAFQACSISSHCTFSTSFLSSAVVISWQYHPCAASTCSSKAFHQKRLTRSHRPFQQRLSRIGIAQLAKAHALPRQVKPVRMSLFSLMMSPRRSVFSASAPQEYAGPIQPRLFNSLSLCASDRLSLQASLP